MVVNTIKELVPNLAKVFDKIEPHFYKGEEQNVIDELFPTCQNVSIDYAVMEKSSDVYVFPASFGGATSARGAAFTHTSSRMKKTTPSSERTSGWLTAKTASCVLSAEKSYCPRS